ncbi:hypothetical protein D869_gp099 [Caulobacter phage CcrRogue]|uniref:Uncharacterized protein n=1 Tax=Caulobacter phage CcrRogue TaxID=2927986 RepID=K4JRA0_9CAUD|nr:hypothetical protein D869_gp002 [Caulobacter phage CcrRogue]YP_006989362.1 hypothetical protein D869_gp099 [Caulobacter phage CcrRogue]AFU86484.1 hypothetical protein CcrRogue_gp002 [Caulobacter phage CcrRogue]AFU86815.1 hypothetical protein CcrRogue_gp333 [Caulobacter phage CcrRogue]
MSIRTFFHDLAVRFVVLGWIFAQKPQKWAPKGHNFQPIPPAQVERQDLRGRVLLLRSFGVLAAACTTMGLCQYLLWRRAPMS